MPGGFVLADRQGRHVRHDDVDAAEFRPYVGDPLLEGGAVGDIQGAAGGADAFGAQGGYCLRDFLGVAGADGYVGSLRRQVFGYGSADAFGAASYDRF